METRNQKGQGLIEYLILVALIAIGTMAAMRLVGESMNVKFTRVAQSLGAKIEGTPPRPTANETVWKKRDMRNFMHGSTGRQQGRSNENDTDGDSD